MREKLVTAFLQVIRCQGDCAARRNDCWQFDLSPSDLKQVPAPLWVEEGRGPPTLMLFSTVDDRSGVAYQEYRFEAPSS